MMADIAVEEFTSGTVVGITAIVITIMAIMVAIAERDAVYFDTSSVVFEQPSLGLHTKSRV